MATPKATANEGPNSFNRGLSAEGTVNFSLNFNFSEDLIKK
ncbi:unnamed protein product [marine sediment metagenome]|uniref:Uncharacterized protein n=1 Tax=marine sediment metagenome TaxID=412755 RepID=X1Q9G1_9ZZZZ